MQRRAIAGYLGVTLGAAALALTAVGGTAAAAGAGYGQPPAQVTVPTGFSTVDVSRNVGGGGGSLKVTVGGVQVQLDIPHGATNTPVQVALSSSSGAKETIPNVLRHWKPVAGFAVMFRQDGHEVRLKKDVKFSIVDKSIQKGDIVLIYNADVHRFVRAQHASISGDKVTVSGLRDGQTIMVVKP